MPRGRKPWNRKGGTESWHNRPVAAHHSVSMPRRRHFDIAAPRHAPDRLPLSATTQPPTHGRRRLGIFALTEVQPVGAGPR